MAREGYGHGLHVIDDARQVRVAAPVVIADAGIS
jgi:hypothetical protein